MALGQDDNCQHKRHCQQQVYETVLVRKLLRPKLARRQRRDLRGKQDERSGRQGIAQGRLRHLERQALDERATQEKLII